MQLLIGRLLVSQPKGFWEAIINWLYSGLKNYGLTIIILTLLIKVAMLPLDFYQKYSQKVMSAQQAAMAPEIARVQKRYGTDRQKLNQETMGVYKRYNFKPLGNCLAMLIYMAVLLTTFITLINGINKIASYKIAVQYERLEAVYDAARGSGESQEDAQYAVYRAYKDDKTISESFLWIKNIWRKDAAEKVIASYGEYASAAKLSKADKNDEVKKAKYNEVMSRLASEEKGWNGYYILVIIAVVSTFFTAKLTMPKKKEGSAAQDPTAAQAAAMGSFSKYIMPLMMGVFAFISQATFGIYLVISQLLSIGSHYAINPFINKAYGRFEKKFNPQVSASGPEYSRNKIEK